MPEYRDPAASAPLSRRRVVTGAAWAMPAILLATTAPAAAASGDPKGTMVFGHNGPFASTGAFWANGINHGPAAVITVALQWTGPYWPVANPISGISFIVTVPKSASPTGQHLDPEGNPGAEFNTESGPSWDTTITKTEDTDNWYLQLTLQSQIGEGDALTKKTTFYVPVTSLDAASSISVLATGTSVGTGPQPAISYP